MGIQRECWAGGLQGSVLPRRLAGPGSDPHHRRPPGERVYHRGPGGVDGVRGQGPGCQWNRDGALEPAGPRQDERVRWAKHLLRHPEWNKTPLLFIYRSSSKSLIAQKCFCLLLPSVLSRNNNEMRIRSLRGVCFTPKTSRQQHTRTHTCRSTANTFSLTFS